MRKIFQGKFLILLLSVFSFSAAFAQTRKLTGKVMDENGKPLFGATVAVKNTKVSTATNVAGVFVLNNVPASAKELVVSFIGMKEQNIVIGERTNFDISMTVSANALSDVVVIGYGKARKVNLTTAQTTVTSKEMDKTINTTVEQAIQGRAAGVYVTQNSGQPGGGMSVLIRGISTINGNSEPLYVIDGVQMQGGGDVSSSNPLAGLNPSDIDDIQILQGPSATAIYGSRATNGVVLITTKRGKAGDARLNYGFQYNVQAPPKRLAVMTLPQYAQMEIDYKAIAGGTVPSQLLDPSILGNGTDWQAELFNNAPMQKHQLNLSGGNSNTTYYMSGEYLNQNGVAVGSGFDRYSFRLNLDNKPREWVKLSANLSFNQTNEKLTTSSESLISNALQLSPEIPVKNIDGTWGGGDLSNPAHQFSPVNPVAISTIATNKDTRRQFLGGLDATINLVKGLVFRTSFNTNIGYMNSTYYRPTYSIGWAVNSTASLQNGTSQNTYWNWNQLLEYNKSFGKHSIDLMASHEAQASTWKNVYGTRTGFLTNDVFDLNAGDATTASNSGGSGEWGMESYLGRITYNYDNRYILMGTIRTDGSVNFGSENRWGTFPSVSLAWRISEEKFFNVPFVNELKLRLETGLTGEQGNGNADIYSPLSAGATPWGTGFLPSVYPNPKKQWEQTNTDNIGLNIGMFQNRVTIDGDYYVKNTDNLLMPASLPWYMGTHGTGAIAPPTVNAGSLQTKGWSFSINTVNINSANFKWQTNLNLSHSKTLIQSLNSDKAFFERQDWWLNQADPWTQRSSIGLEPWLFRGYIQEGIFTSVDEINNSAVPVDNSGNRYPTSATNGIWIGDVKFKDINGDGKIDVNDMTNIGSPWPKLFGGFTNTFSYKGFDLSILITGTYGNDIYNFMAWQNSNPNNINLGRNMMLAALDYAKVSTDKDGNPVLLNPGTVVPRIISGNDVNGNYARQTSKWVEDGSYLRLKNVSLSYNLPSTFIAKQKLIRGVRATVGVQNIVTLTNYTGMDPEVGSYVGANTYTGNQAIGLDFGRYPLTPVYTFSLNVNF